MFNKLQNLFHVIVEIVSKYFKVISIQLLRLSIIWFNVFEYTTM